MKRAALQEGTEPIEEEAEEDEEEEDLDGPQTLSLVIRLLEELPMDEARAVARAVYGFYEERK